ncbi:secretin-like G protein-coupled receptor [Aureococcus anophagefferens]|uniref:Secretin-like G protein-coupled receptor n=1 Tax=Aureococcus anophagefferens TaxID=44056 RepID=A0ABR1FHN2_AURAN
MPSFAAALFSCALVIASGYFAGRVKVIRVEGEGPRALGTFIGRFSLPALLFKELATLSFASIDVHLLVAIATGKAAVFFGVLLCTALLESRRGGDATQQRKVVAVSALRAIFCTQSNDFALGLPVMTALYKDTRPEMVSMLYLLSPVSLLLLNPVGFLLMGAASPGPDAPPDDDDDVAPTIEDSPRPSAASAPRGPERDPGRVLLRVVRTPLVACTVAGALFNVVFGPSALPSPFAMALGALGAAFTPCALFFTGLSLVGKVTKLHPSALLLPGVLSGIKCVVLPIAIYLAVGLTGGDGDLRGFGFVYGAIPTAPSVLVYAHEYLGHDPETAATTAVSLVVCTLASTPVVLFAGLVIQAGHVGVVLDEYARTTDAYLCVPSCVLAAWVAASFYATWRADWARRKDETGAAAWKPADTRVLLLVVNAGCHALGALDTATDVRHGRRARSAPRGATARRAAKADHEEPLLPGRRRRPCGGGARGGARVRGRGARRPVVRRRRRAARGACRATTLLCGYPYGRPQYGASVAYLGVTLALCLLGLRKARETQDRYYARSRQDLAALDAETKAPDDLPGGADTLDGTADLAAFGASLGRRRQQLSLSFSSLPGDDPRDATDTRLAAAVGHRLLLFILLHVIHAFLNICACAARLGPRDGFGKAGSTVKVLSLIADTFSSSMGIFIFLVFGLARHQVLWRATSDQLKRLCCVPRRQRGGASPSGLVRALSSSSAGSDGRRRHARDRLTSFDVNEVS